MADGVHCHNPGRVLNLCMRGRELIGTRESNVPEIAKGGSPPKGRNSLKMCAWKNQGKSQETHLVDLRLQGRNVQGSLIQTKNNVLCYAFTMLVM